MNNAQHWHNYYAHKHLSTKARAWGCYRLWKSGFSVEYIAANYGISIARVYSLCREIGQPISTRGVGQ